MISQETFWGVFDEIAKRNGIALSAMSVQTGLDKTSLLPSKRHHNGEMRWPSTETLARVLNGMGMTERELAEILAGNAITTYTTGVPATTMSRLISKKAFNDNGERKLDAWEVVDLPIADSDTWVVMVDRHQPDIRDNAQVMVSDKSEIRPGDRVLVVSDAFTGFGKLRRQTATTTVIQDTETGDDHILQTPEVQKLSRVLWVEA
jgi:hypothetical protein